MYGSYLISRNDSIDSTEVIDAITAIRQTTFKGPPTVKDETVKPFERFDPSNSSSPHPIVLIFIPGNLPPATLL